MAIKHFYHRRRGDLIILASWFETQSLPSLLRCYHRSFTFYLGNPFPRFLINHLDHAGDTYRQMLLQSRRDRGERRATGDGLLPLRELPTLFRRAG
jgi:hypothetical protein